MLETRLGNGRRFALAAQLALAIGAAGLATRGLAADLVMEIGGSGSGDGQFDEINGIAVGRDGRIYVVDLGNSRIQVFDRDGSFAYSFGSFGFDAGEFDSVCGIAVNDDLGRLYVSEGIPAGANHRIQVFGLDGTFLFQFGSAGSGPGQFESPCQMAFGPDDELYVVDRQNWRVQILDADGGFISAFGSLGTGDAEFNLPSGIAIDLSGQVFVADSFSPRIQVFDFAGSFLYTIGEAGTATGQFNRPCHLAQGGMLMVADALNERVQVFTLAGHFQLAFPVTGTIPSIFCSNGATGLATDRLGRIYVEEGDFVRVYSIDRDADGLPDHWETSGVDIDADGVVDLPLHEAPYNADPDHKDLFLEFDWDERTPVAAHVIQEMKDILCAAPVDAGGVANPDGEPGIRLHADTGSLTDPLLSESRRVPCSCRDGMDNDGDSQIDSADSSCFAPDPAGGEGDAGFVTCDDDLDNDGDGNVDDGDADCPLVYDEFASEFPPLTPAQCADGVDNDGDGDTDGDDVDCAVGDDLGGGTVLTDTTGEPFSGEICDLGEDFYVAKARHFDPVRSMVFRYAIQAPKCDLDGDGDLDSRSRAELGGNDTLQSTIELPPEPPGLRLSPASYLHELGHTLNLTHGGNDARNCEPNYVSIMNYDSGFGLRQVVRTALAGTFDFSPARFPGGRANAPLPVGDLVGELDESALDERTILDPEDRLHQFVFVNALGEKARSPVNGDVDGDGDADGADWDGDGAVTDASGLVVNLDTTGPTDAPLGCFNTAFEVLTGHDDWSNLSLPFRQFGNLADAPLNPTETPEPTLEEQIALETALNTTDLAIHLVADADPIEAGAEAMVTVTADNLGPNPADRVGVALSLGASPLLLPPACLEGASGVDCEFGPLSQGKLADLALTLGGESSCSGGLPTPLEISATIENASEFAGPDPDSSDNAANLVIDRVDTTAPTIACNAPVTIAPNSAPTTITPSVDDLCDDDATLTITSVQCFRITPSGDRVDLPCRIDYSDGILRIRQTGGVGSRIEWTVEALDASGNRAESRCQLAVVRAGA